jgi:hypothetical protein
MVRPGRRKKAKKYLYYQLLLSVAIILFLGAMGIGYACWNDFLYVEGTVTTGFIEPVFYEPRLSVNGCQGRGEVLMSEQGKKLYVDIQNARHGDVFFLDFKIKNEGTVPVKAETLVVTSGKALDIKLIHEPDSIIEGQDMSQGQIRIKVRKVAEDSDNAFMVQLSFHQITVF